VSRFSRLSSALAAKGAYNPDALAAHIGRKKYGRAGFAALAKAGRAKKRAKRAVKKVAAAAMTGQMLGVELARPGAWHTMNGNRTFTEVNLRDAADFFAASGQTRIPIGFGHADRRFDGDPAFGWVANIRLTTDAKGPVLLGDLVDMEDWVAAAAPSRWPNRSIEGFANLDWNGRTYSLALTRLALLGSTPPAMPTLRSLADLREAVAAAAESSGAEFIAASAPDPDPDLDLELSEPIEPDTTDPRPPAEKQPTKETGMDPAKFREALGLTDDVSDDEVMSALADAGFIPKDEEPAPVAASAPALSAAPPGTVVLASSVYDELLETNRKLKAFVDKSERNERDQVIAAAVQAGKLRPWQRQQFADLWDSNPKGTRAVLDTLTASSSFPVMAAGYDGGVEEEEDDLDREIARLSPPTASGKVA